MTADLKQRIAEFLAAVNNPANLTTTREHLAKAVALLKEVANAD